MLCVLWIRILRKGACFNRNARQRIMKNNIHIKFEEKKLVICVFIFIVKCLARKFLRLIALGAVGLVGGDVNFTVCSCYRLKILF